MANGEQGKVGERHQAPAMGHPAGIHVLALNPEGGNRPLVIDTEVERSGSLVLEGLFGPGGPACKFTARYNRSRHGSPLFFACGNHTPTAPFDKRAVGA